MFWLEETEIKLELNWKLPLGYYSARDCHVA